MQWLAGCAAFVCLSTLASPAAGAGAPAGFGPAFKVKGLRPMFSGETPTAAAWNGKLILSASAPGEFNGLWITDGTEAGTRLLRANMVVLPGTYHGDPAFVPFDGALYFAAREWSPETHSTASGLELWRTDGTPEGTRMVADVNPGPADAMPSELTVARGKLYFVAGYGGTGTSSHLGLFRTDGTAAGTVQVATLEGIAADYRPQPRQALTAAGANLFLRHRVFGRGFELHRVDTCASPPAFECVVLVKDLAAPNMYWLGSYPDMLVAVGDLLLFVADGESGSGLYRSDGTVAGTSLLAPASFMREVNAERLSIAAGGFAYFVTNDGLLRSDGKPEGTALLAAGHVPWQQSMTSALGVVYFLGANATGNRNEPWNDYGIWRSDGTPTGTHALADICPGTCNSAKDPTPPLALAPEGRLFFAATNDGTWNGLALWTSDGTAAGTVPVQEFRELTGLSAAPPWNLVRAGDLVYFGLSVPSPWWNQYDSELWAVRTDLADRTPPDLACPATVKVEATSAGGGFAGFAVTAHDNLTPGLQATLSAAPGLFPLGSTTVTASAEDEAGNVGTCSFQVVVRDTTPPVVACPAEVAAEAVAPEGTQVSFAVAAVDAVSTATVSTSLPSGAVFAPGSTAVTATATDAAGNGSSCAFTVRVLDTRPPIVACPPAQVLEMTSPDGAIGDWPDASAVDRVGVVTVSYVPARGTLLGPGAHAVVASASDDAGNASSCGFTVTVRDTTAPAITCPADVLATAPGPGGVAVTFPPPLASDAVTPAAVVVLDHLSREVFPVGVTTVRATARDATGNVGACSFRVEVRVVTSSSDTPPEAAGTSEASGSPASSSGCSTAASEPAALLTPLAALAALAVRRRRSSRANPPVRRQRCEMA